MVAFPNMGGIPVNIDYSLRYMLATHVLVIIVSARIVRRVRAGLGDKSVQNHSAASRKLYEGKNYS